MKPLSDCRLYTFVDFSYLRDRSPQTVAQQLCDGGSDLIQLRAKNLSSDEVCRVAEILLPITEQARVGLVINDHLEVALRIGAPVSHLGQEDLQCLGRDQIAEILPAGATLRIGLSTHNPVQARAAVMAGADYIAVGPVYATPTKPAAVPVTLDYVSWAAANINLPWFAIGGINQENLDAVLAAGARRICVVSAILNAPDLPQACLHFKNRLSSVPL